ncbi:hypothetical protein [Rheinheimera sp.]|jgi:hypothetical protein|uniref:hypothetical protein n=1 Tax=Rheinheimera sp. TaxID=1869214 RepID=UPI00261F5F06|nr:hypothetical protein [Rheinheimera sp.]MCA1931635.1 hypothetical protein [Rheinheimera sp.]
MQRGQTKAYQLQLLDQVLWVRVFGVSTVLGTEEYIRDFRAMVAPILNQPWAVVLDIRQWQASPAQSLELLKQNSIWAFAQNLHHVELLLPVDEMLTWQYLKATEVEKPTYLTKHIAEDEESARLFLQAAGYLKGAD